jgi:hypothetical protein
MLPRLSYMPTPCLMASAPAPAMRLVFLVTLYLSSSPLYPSATNMTPKAASHAIVMMDGLR